MDAGYEPGRVQQLLRRTWESIERLDAISSSDPAAADALRTIRLTRSNLEDHWMRALRDIERSAPMGQWRASQLGTFGLRSLWALGDTLPDHLRPGRPIATSIPPQRRVELLGQLDWLERKSVAGDTAPGAPTETELADLAEDVAYWVQRDDGFAEEIVGLSTSNMTVARLLGAARFPSWFSSRIVQQMAAPNGPDTGVDVARYATSLSRALERLAGDPGACLDLLLDDRTAYALAAWDALDPVALEHFVSSGLMDSVVDDATRLADGFRVVNMLTRAATGPLDEGMSAGMARGVALSMPVFFPLLSGGIFQTGAKPVRVSEFALTIGTYSEVANLFGAVMRDDQAAGALGVALGTFTDRELSRDGLDLTEDGSFTHVVHLSLLLDHAAKSEQAQLIMEAAAAQGRRDGLASVLGAGTNIALLTSGVGAAWRSAASLAIRTVTDAIDDVDARQLAGASIASRQYEQIWMSAMADALERPATLGAARRDPTLRTKLADFRARLDAIEACNDPLRRSELVIDLRSAAEGTIVDAYLDEVTATDGLPTIR
ncbi:MAG TPA: hypothetical protein VMY16_09920 [Ilumatobacteraceae bacterium]|nr:hypothetical protein [Ilumatobacteraceae bacterium]